MTRHTSRASDQSSVCVVSETTPVLGSDLRTHRTRDERRNVDGCRKGEDTRCDLYVNKTKLHQGTAKQTDILRFCSARRDTNK